MRGERQTAVDGEAGNESRKKGICVYAPRMCLYVCVCVRAPHHTRKKREREREGEGG